MDSRIPLSVVLQSPGRKHETVPSRTYTALATDDFFRYLSSDDTRLPRHRLLQNYKEAPENYNTYVGEDDLIEAGPSHSATSDEDGEEPVGPPPAADDVVDWVAQVLAEPWAEDGVVLCGRYVVADDCAWATSSRTSRLSTVREVFVAMRGSNKFIQDVTRQLVSDKNGCVEFSIVKAVAAEESKEMRVFVPCLLTFSLDRCAEASETCQHSRCVTRTSTEGHLHAGDLLYEYAGVTQRVTEACFPALMSWSEEEHDVVFRRVVERVKEARLLERALEQDTGWCARLVAQFRRRQARTRTASPSSTAADSTGASSTLDEAPIWLFLAVDVLFDSLQLPIYLLSAKVRLFSPDQLAQNKVSPTARLLPFIAESSFETSAQQPSQPPENDDDDEDESWEDAREATDVRSFLRLFRDEFNWNQYTQLLHQRLESHKEAGAAPMRYFCAVASEAADLVTCGDTLTKRGLPLEFSRPELIAHNPQAMQHVQEFLLQQQQHRE